MPWIYRGRNQRDRSDRWYMVFDTEEEAIAAAAEHVAQLAREEAETFEMQGEQAKLIDEILESYAEGAYKDAFEAWFVYQDNYEPDYRVEELEWVARVPRGRGRGR